MVSSVVLVCLGKGIVAGRAKAFDAGKLDKTACILMLTGSNARADVDTARKAGAAGYVTKDRIAAELIDAILEVVGR